MLRDAKKSSGAPHAASAGAFDSTEEDWTQMLFRWRRHPHQVACVFLGHCPSAPLNEEARKTRTSGTTTRRSFLETSVGHGKYLNWLTGRVQRQKSLSIGVCKIIGHRSQWQRRPLRVECVFALAFQWVDRPKRCRRHSKIGSALQASASVVADCRMEDLCNKKNPKKS